jgi:hypothetical protein
MNAPGWEQRVKVSKGMTQRHAPVTPLHAEETQTSPFMLQKISICAIDRPK